jgi:hypothetical protein
MCSNDNLENTFILDFADLSQKYETGVILNCGPNNTVELDLIEISMETFMYIFYPYKDNFGINVENVCNNRKYYQYITFLPPFRKIKGENFNLIDTIIGRIETDLGVSRNCFTSTSLISINKELSVIKTLCDINCCSVINSLTWPNIISIIKLTNQTRNLTKEPYSSVIFNLRVIFHTPNEEILETIILFRYKVNIDYALFPNLL